MDVGFMKCSVLVFFGNTFCKVNIEVCCHFAAVLCRLDTILLSAQWSLYHF